MPAERVCVGVITGAHGVRGAVRIRSFTERPADVAAYGPVSDEGGRRSFRLRVTGEKKGAVVAEIPGVEDRAAAEALKGLRLYVPRTALPEPEEEEYYHADLIGLAVELTDGTPLGEVAAVHDFGAGAVIEVERPRQGPVVVPFTRQVVPVVDVGGGRLVVDPPTGLLGPVEEEPGEADEAGGRRSRGKSS